MQRRCQVCSAPVVAGYRFCGGCGAVLDAPASDDALGRGRQPVDPDLGPLPPAGPGGAPGVATASAPGEHAGDGPTGPAAPDQTTPRWRAVVAVVALLSVGFALVRFGAPDDDRATAPVASDGGGRSVDLELPDLAGEVEWSVSGAPTSDVLGPYPWAAPVLAARHVVVVAPGAVLFHDRDAGSAGTTRVDLPTTGRSAPVVLDRAGSTVVVVADGSAWVVDPSGVVARSEADDVADVTPMALGGGAVLVEGEFGDLRRLDHRESVLAETARVRGVDTVPEGAPVPRFQLAVRALVDGRPWVASRDRGGGDWSLVRLDPTSLGVELEYPVGQSVPTILETEDGGLAVASADVVTVLEPDGRRRWVEAPGPQAELLGVDDGLLLVRHAEGRIVYAVGDARIVARATLGLIQGARSQEAGGEVLALDGVTLVAIRVRDATVSRRLDGRALSLGGQVDGLVAWVAAGSAGHPVLRLLPTPDRAPTLPGEGVAREVSLAVARPCSIAGAGDVIAWHDGATLREVGIDDGTLRADVAAGSARGSTIAVQGDRLLVVDERGVVRAHRRGLEDVEVLPIGDDPIGGAAVAGDLAVVAGGTGRLATLSSTSGYLRGVRADGSSAWLVRTPESVVSPPVARGDVAAVRTEEGAVVLVAGGVLVAVVPANRTSLDPPVLDARGAVLRDGDDVVAVFPAGEEAWRVTDLRAAPGLATDGDLVLVRTARGVIALDRATGAVRWEADVEAGTVGPTIIAGERVVVPLVDALVVLDRATGEVASRVDDLPALAGPVVATTAGVVACAADGRLLLVR